jgi:hypothetical protein
MDEPTITRVEKTQKLKDPRRVESGKRLAAVSREAKARKAAERRNAENNPDQGDSVNALIYAGAATAALGGIYYVYCRVKPTDKSTDKPTDKSNHMSEPQMQDEPNRRQSEAKPKFEKFNN